MEIAAVVTIFLFFLVMFMLGIGRILTLAFLATVFVVEWAKADCVPFTTADAMAYIESVTSYRAPEGAMPPPVLEGHRETMEALQGYPVYGLTWHSDGSIAISDHTPSWLRNSVWVHELVHWYQYHAGELQTLPSEIVELKAHTIHMRFDYDTADLGLCPIEFDYPLE